MHIIILILAVGISCFSSNASSCAIFTSITPENTAFDINTSKPQNSWDLGGGNIPFTIDDVIDTFNNNKVRIIEKSLKFDKKDNYLDILNGSVNYSADIFRITLTKSLSMGWFYEFHFSLKLHLNDGDKVYQHSIYSDNMEDINISKSPKMGVSLNGALLFPINSKCG
ncbi:hypothetical protein [Colwellia piezophila]|uniref:hypothetical protein n=1 Tax=Colwellia piezophila TaxID=211668 RepID=UPI000377A3E7|nr:hypothetical protein [Colwellia piezophila]